MLSDLQKKTEERKKIIRTQQTENETLDKQNQLKATEIGKIATMIVI